MINGSVSSSASVSVLLRNRLRIRMEDRDVRGSLELDAEIRKVSPRASNIRGGGGTTIVCGGIREGELERDRDWEEDGRGDKGGGCCPAQLGILTISSVSNVRASMTCKREVC